MLALVLASLTVAAPRAPHKPNVLDDLLALPADALDGMADSNAERKQALRTTDLANGYLVGTTDDGAFRVALFVTKDGRHLLGVQLHGIDMGCETFDPPKFYAPSDKGWVEVTAQVWPRFDPSAIAAKVRAHFDAETIQQAHATQCDFSPEDVVWELPRKGTAVRARSSIGEYVVLTCKWDRVAGRFVADDPKLLAH